MSLSGVRTDNYWRMTVVVAAVIWSTTGIVQRMLTVDLATQLAGRATVAALGLALFIAVTQRGRASTAWRSMGCGGFIVSACIATNSVCFIAAFNYESVGRATFIATLGLMLAAVIAWLAFRDPIDGVAACALAIAALGATLMFGAPGAVQPLGDMFAIIAAVAWAVGIVVARHNRSVSMLPATCLAQVVVAAAAFPFAHPMQITVADGGYLSLGGLQVAVGLGLVTAGARRLPAVQVATLSILEAPLAPLWVWWAMGERPDPATLVGGVVIILAAGVQATRGSLLPVSGVPVLAPGASEPTGATCVALNDEVR